MLLARLRRKWGIIGNHRKGDLRLVAEQPGWIVSCSAWKAELVKWWAWNLSWDFPAKCWRQPQFLLAASSEMEEKREKLRKELFGEWLGKSQPLFTLQMIKLGDSLSWESMPWRQGAVTEAEIGRVWEPQAKDGSDLESEKRQGNGSSLSLHQECLPADPFQTSEP